MQEEILAKLREKYGHLTFKEMSKVTGIHPTRLFRLWHGCRMWLEEYDTLKKCLYTPQGQTVELALACEANLSSSANKEIQQLLERKIGLWMLVNKSKTNKKGVPAYAA